MKFNLNNEERRWKNEDRFNNFMDFLYEKLELGENVCSDSFYFNSEYCKPYSPEHFEKYLLSLYDIVGTYAEKNYIRFTQILGEDDEYYTDEDNIYILNYKDKFYSIERISGQGSFVAMRCLTNFDKEKPYINYDLMVNNKKSENYMNNLKEDIFENLDIILPPYLKNNDEKTILDLLKRYIEEMEN